MDPPVNAEHTSAAVKRRRTWAVLGLVVVLIAGGVTAGLLLTRGNSSPPQASTQHNCVSPGCGLVSQSLQQVQPVGFYGASCSGATGDWFMKIMQTGTSDQLRTSYDLHWTLGNGAPAKPSGTVVIRPTTGAAKGSNVTLTVDQGKLKLQGTEEPSKTSVSATGTLTVSFVNRPGFPTLRFAETGLTQAESSLGLNSPFNFDGKPLNLLIRHVAILVGC